MVYVVKKCVECPFFAPKDEKIGVCGASIPKHRPLDKDADRPSFCPLRREQIIVREFS